MTDVPVSTDVISKDLHEQRRVYRVLTRSMEDLARRGVEPPAQWQAVHLALSDHFIALSQGR